MITPYKGRKVDLNTPVWVYRNLSFRDGKVYSVRQNGLVVGHTTRLVLLDCSFKINKMGQKKVIKEQRKNVHAFVIGYIIKENKTTKNKNKLKYQVFYNPYQNNTFVCKTPDNKNYSIYEADLVLINENGLFAANADSESFIK